MVVIPMFTPAGKSYHDGPQFLNINVRMLYVIEPRRRFMMLTAGKDIFPETEKIIPFVPTTKSSIRGVCVNLMVRAVYVLDGATPIKHSEKISPPLKIPPNIF